MQNLVQSISIFRTRNPDQFAEFIQIALPTDIRVSTYRWNTFQVDATAMRLPHTGLLKIRAAYLKAKDSEFREFVSITIPLNGEISILNDNRYRSYTQGSTNLNWGNEALDFQTRKNSNLVINFDRRKLLTCWNKFSVDRDFDELKKIFRFNLYTPNGADFWSFIAKLWSECYNNPSLVYNEKAIQKMEENLMTLFLLAVDAQSNPQTIEKSCRQRNLNAVADAEDYIIANLNQAISIADIAQAAKLHPRTLFRAFYKRHGYNPAAFHKQRRLEAVQRSLLGGDLETETVTKHAMHFGFGSMGQFALDYRKAFGESPSETLKH
jgi:AraC-like DNA-binding protein